MAKKIINEQIKLDVIVNGAPAQKELYNLEKDTRELSEATKKLNNEKKKLAKQGKQNSERYRELTQKIRENNATITKNKERMSQLQNEIGLTNMSISQLTKKAKELQAAMNHMIPGGKQYEKYAAELSRVNARISQLRGDARRTGLTFDSLTNKFNKYVGVVSLITATIGSQIYALYQLAQQSAKLADAQSDVMKTTQMNKEQVDELTKSLGKLNTRTPRQELLKLAEEGGRLGITGVDNILKWVNVANQLKVALGDDLSEEQIRDLGKLVTLYKVGEETGREFEGAMLSLGSAINEVSASGANQAGFLVDYMKRTGGIITQAKLSAANNVAYAATFDEIGQTAEVSATVMNKVVGDMFKNPADYAKVAKMEVGAFKDLLNKDFNQAMIAFLKGLNGNQAGLEMLMVKMKDLDVGGTRGAAAISALASNLEILEARQATSNQAMQEATSLTNEYAIKNENLAGILDKIKKKINGLFTSESVVKFVSNFLNWFAKFIGASEDASGEVTKWRGRLLNLVKVLSILTIGWMSYRAAILLTSKSIKDYYLAQKVVEILEARRMGMRRFLKMMLIQLSKGYYNLTGNTTRAAAAQRLLNRAQMENPIGLVLGLLSMLIASLVFFSSSTDEAAEKQKKLNVAQRIAVEQQESFSKSLNKTKSEIDPLIKILKDETASIEVRRIAYEKLISINNSFVGTVNDEFIATEKLSTAYDKLIRKLKALSLAKARTKVRDELAEEYAEAEKKEFYAKLATDAESEENKKIKEENERRAKIYKDHLENSSKNNAGAYFTKKSLSNQAKEEYEKAKAETIEKRNRLEEYAAYQEKELKLLQNQLKKLKKGTEEYNEVKYQIEALIGTVNETTEPTDGGSGGFHETKEAKKDKKAEQRARKLQSEHEERLREIERYHKEVLQLNRKFEDDKLTMLGDGYDKEQAQLDEEHKRSIEDLQSKLVAVSDIEEAQRQSKNKKLSNSQRKSFETLANQWLTYNESVYQKIEQQTDLYNYRKAALVEKYAKSEIDILKEKYEEEEKVHSIAHNEALVRLGNDEEAKKELNEKFKEEQIEREIAHLQEIIDLYNQMIGDATINGIDFSLLSPEQENKLRKEILTIEEAISRLKAAKKVDEPNDSEMDLGLGKTDMLGFTQDQWNRFFENIDRGTIGFQTMTMAVQALGNIWNQYNAMVEDNTKEQLNSYEESSQKKEKRLKAQLNAGIINEEQYNSAVHTLTVDLDRKKAILQTKAAKRKRQIDLINAYSSTALAVLNALNTKPFFPLGLAMAGIATSMGALQIAKIYNTPLPAPGYEEGLYGSHIIKRQQDGKLFNAKFGGQTKSGIVNQPTFFLTGENGPEMIIDSKAYKQLPADLTFALESRLRGIKGYEDGYYPRQEEPMRPPQISDANAHLMGKLLNVLERLEEKEFVAYVSNRDLSSMRNLKKGIEDFENFRNRTKIDK